MMPLLQRMSVYMKKNDYLYLLFWNVIFMGIMPIIIHYFPAYSYCDNFNVAILPIYIGIVFVGYFVSYEVCLKWKYFLMCIAIFAGCIAIQVFGTVIESRVNTDSYLFWDNRTYLPITLSASACFYMVRYIDSKWKNENVKKLLERIGGCTFGAYLLSDLLIALYVEPYYAIMGRRGICVALVVYEIMIYVTGIFITAILKCIPGVKKLL